MPDETTDRYRAAAEAYFGEAYADMPWNPKWAERMAETPCFRAAVDANRERDEAAGREAAAKAIEARRAGCGDDSLGYLNGLDDAAEIARGEHRG